MKVVGITGGIGSGKTTVAKMFEALGIPVYYADDEAKKLTDSSPAIKQELIALLGEDLYSEGRLNRPLLAQIIFNDNNFLQRVNNIIHPRVAEHFQEWVSMQNSPYILKEAAILFESGTYKNCDLVILVTAPEDIRIQRVMERDNVTKEQVLARIKNQWEESKKIELSDFIIENLHLPDTQIAVQKIHRDIIAKI